MTRIYFILLFTLTSYAARAGATPSVKPKVVSTVSMIADMVDNIAGEFIDHETIVPRGSDPHLYEPTPSDAVLIYEADVVFFNGLTFEGWLEKVVDNSGSKAQTVIVSQGVDAIRSSEYQGSADPHAWMDVSNAFIYCQHIQEALVALMPEHSEVIKQNYKRYLQQLNDLDQRIASEIQRIPPEKRILITSHDAFSYYGRRYGLELHSLAGVSTEAAPKTSDIIAITDIIKKSQVPAIFLESTINPKLIKSLAYDQNVRVGGELFADSLGPEGGKAATYMDMMWYNTQTIVEALLSDRPTSPEKESGRAGSSIYLWLMVGVVAILALYFILR